MIEWVQQYLDYAESRYSAKTYSEKKLAFKGLFAAKTAKGKPLGAIQAILRHKSAGTTERYLKSLGLEETRVHLEALCDMRKPVEEANRASGKKPAEVINIKDRLEKRSQAV